MSVFRKAISANNGISEKDREFWLNELGDVPSSPDKTITRFNLDTLRELRKRWGTEIRSNPTEPQPKPKGSDE